MQKKYIVICYPKLGTAEPQLALFKFLLVVLCYGFTLKIRFLGQLLIIKIKVKVWKNQIYINIFFSKFERKIIRYDIPLSS